MYQDILKDEWFHVYSDDHDWENDKKVKNWLKLNIFPRQIMIPGVSLRGVRFSEYPHDSWGPCNIICGVISFDERAIEHIVGCFYFGWTPKYSNLSIFPRVDHWFTVLNCNTLTKSRKNQDQNFDLDNDEKTCYKTYYTFGVTKIELNFPDERKDTDIMELLEFGRKKYAAQKIPRICERAVCDCEVKCV